MHGLNSASCALFLPQASNTPHSHICCTISICHTLLSVFFHVAAEKTPQQKYSGNMFSLIPSCNTRGRKRRWQKLFCRTFSACRRPLSLHAAHVCICSVRPTCCYAAPSACTRACSLPQGHGRWVLWFIPPPLPPHLLCPSFMNAPRLRFVTSCTTPTSRTYNIQVPLRQITKQAVTRGTQAQERGSQ